MQLFSDFQYGFRTSWSTTDLLTVIVSDGIARVFNSAGAAWAVALDISKAFNRVVAGLLQKFKSLGILDQIFGLISSFLTKKQLQVVLDGKSSREYPVNAEVSQG